ncbi:hypothetical protein [Acidovorax sp. Root217]|uniref:hypothetical protein n=1 Tax=Acidovorax sp. Root217 TaxID=1736492 RepID=UPI00070DD8A6|nr:hypothetical protein [Acidovorax sp. Root217]KRC26915.1 hypothetical protein ASE31_15810 [Acidovorax sp. Root217]
MSLLMSAWPILVWVLLALVVLSALFFLAKGDRRAFAQLLGLVACFLIGALLMEFMLFMAARMSRTGGVQGTPVLGDGTRQLLQTIANPRSITAPPLSMAAVAAYSVPLSYLWLAVTWVLHLHGGGKSGAGKKKKPAKASGKSRKA